MRRLGLVSAFALLTGSCGGGGSDSSAVHTVALPPMPIPAPTPAPAPTPTSSAGPENAATQSIAAIASNFDPIRELVATSLPPSAAPDVVGAFRFICMPGQLKKDDPIVYPGQPGRRPLHQSLFIGADDA